MTPQETEILQRVVMAGMKIMFAPQTFPMLKSGIEKEQPMPQKLAENAVGLLKILQDKAGGNIPRQLLIPAAAMLMLEIGKTMHDLKMPEPTAEDVKAAYSLLAQMVAKEFPRNGAPTQQPPQPAAQPAAQPAGLLAQGG